MSTNINNNMDAAIRGACIFYALPSEWYLSSFSSVFGLFFCCIFYGSLFGFRCVGDFCMLLLVSHHHRTIYARALILSAALWFPIPSIFRAMRVDRVNHIFVSLMIWLRVDQPYTTQFSRPPRGSAPPMQTYGEQEYRPPRLCLHI